MPKKRANGEGSLRKRKDGRWEGRYTAGCDRATGKPIHKSVLAKTQSEAKEQKKAPDFLRNQELFGGDCWTRTSDLLRVNGFCVPIIYWKTTILSRLSEYLPNRRCPCLIPHSLHNFRVRLVDNSYCSKDNFQAFLSYCIKINDGVRPTNNIPIFVNEKLYPSIGTVQFITNKQNCGDFFCFNIRNLIAKEFYFPISVIIKSDNKRYCL